MNIYLSNTTNFSNNGLGFLTDIISANVIDELNGNYELQLAYIRDGKLSEYLVEENIIKCKVSDSTYQLFRITNVEKTFKTITIIAKHIFYDLLNNFLENTYPQNLSCQLFLQHILDHTNFSNSFTAVSDISTTKTARYVRMNPVSAIIGDNNNSMVNLFGGELKRDNFTINFLSRVGSNNGVKLLIGKNITGINISIDITSMATRIMPQGFDGLLLPELYVDSPLINNYPTPKIVKIEFSDVVYDPDVENAYHDIQDAYAELRRRAEEQYSLGIDKPKINIKIDWIELSKTEEYKSYQNLERVNLGDTITAYILGINYETRVISTNYDVLKDMIVDFEIGTVKPSITSSMSKIQKSVEEINPDSILKTAKDEATELITTAMGGYVYKTESELYIMNTNDPTTATKVWRWNINGLGYSSTGINGPYGIAMTMDGAIVADYITTGTLNTSVIQGYDSIVTTVSGISTTYETKTDATSKLNTAKTYAESQAGTAETNAKGYTDGQLENYSTTTEMNSAITQKANEITSTVSETYITKTDSATNINTAKSEAISSANSSTDTKLQNYTNTTDMNTAIGTAENNAKTYADGKASTVENNAKTYADGVSSTAETNAKNYTDSELDNITNTIDETTTGKSFYIENAQNEKPIEMEFYGDTEQNTYGGKNLFDKNNTYWNKAGTTLSLLDTGVRATLNSAITYRYGVIAIPNSDNLLGKTVTLSFTKNESGNNVGLVRLYSLDSSGNPITSYTSQSNFTANLPNSYTGNATQFGLLFYSNVNGTDVSTGDYVDYTNVQLEQGSTATSYEKYVGGTPSPNPDYPQNIEVVTGRQTIDIVGKNILGLKDGTYTATDITATVSNGEITLNGTASANRLVTISLNTNLYIDLNETITLSMNNPVANSNVRFRIDDGSYLDTILNSNSKTNTINVNYNLYGTYIKIRVASGTSLSDFKLKPMIEKGSTPTEYEPYNEKPYEINLGKNLFDYTTSTFSNPSVVNIVAENNTLTITTTTTTTSNGLFFLTKIPDNILQNGAVYTISSENVSGVVQSLKLQLRNKDGSYYNSTRSDTMTYNNNYSLYITGNIFSNTSSTSIPSGTTAIIKNIQIEKGNVATTYSPYKTPIELCKINDYQDKIFKRDDRWYLRKEIGKVVLDGSESWSRANNNNGTYRFYKSRPTDTISGTTTNLYSNYFNPNSAYTTNDNSIYIGSTNLIISRVLTNGNYIDLLDDFKNWLSTHNTNVYYILATPTEEPITNEELINQLDAFELMTGINNISINSNDLAADMYLKYYLHTPISDTYVNKVELNSQLKITSESISSEVNATYETKTDATSKLNGAKTYADGVSSTAESNAKTYAENQANTAETNAKGYTDNQLTSYSTTTQMNSAITQKADEIAQSVSQTYTTLDVTGGLSERVEAAEGNLTTQGAKLNIISKNIDSTTGDIKSVKTLKGFTLDDEGFKIATSESDFNSLSNETGTYYKDGDTILTQFTKDNSITKDLVLYGTYYYGVDKDLDVSNFTKDDAMFVAEKYTDNNNEVGFGHFYNGGD